jgi:hypothetical protein
MLLFYIAVYDSTDKTNIVINSLKLGSILFGFIFLIFNLVFLSENEFFIPVELNISLFWDDFYESLINDKMNDLFGVMLSFYVFNSFEFLLVGFLLLLGSLICVNLNRFIKTSKVYNYSTYFSIFDFFKDSVKMGFLRKQNLTNQTKQPANSRFVKSKVMK